MGLFDIFKKKPIEINTVKGNNSTLKNQVGCDILIELAGRLSDQDRLVLLDLKHYAASPQDWFTDHREQMAERGVDTALRRDVPWLILADGLEEQNYACEVDWKCDVDSFVWALGALYTVKEKSVTVRVHWFDPDTDVQKWSRILDEKWAPQGFCLAALDIDSDSYVLIPVKTGEFEALRLLAEQAGFRLAHAFEL